MDLAAQAPVDADTRDRRGSSDRRRVTFKSVLYGAATGNRRRRVRRAADHGRLYLDWYDPTLLYTSVAVLLLSCTDAFFTLILLSHGAVEMNALMARLIETDVALFTVVKTSVTGFGLVVLVAHCGHRLFGRVPVRLVLPVLLAGYLLLLGHELAILAQLPAG